MEKGKMIVVNLDELASRWLIPVDRLMYLITDCDMDMQQPEKWAAQHWDLIMEEKRKAIDDLLFPRKFRPEAAVSST